MIGTNAMRRTAAVTLAVAGAITMATPTLGACGLTAAAVAKADASFVGQLTGVSGDGTSATFKVEQVWRGSGLVVDEMVQVDTTGSLQSLELPPAGVPASRYLVLAMTVGGQLHTGDSCEVFPFPWDASYAAFRPADASPPTGSEDDSGGPPVEVLVLIGMTVLAAGVSAYAFRRTRAPGA